jgi:sortase A
MRKYLSRALLALIVIGLAIVAWSAITIIWQEPVTAIQHHRQEAKLEKQLAKAEKAQEHRPSVRRPVLPHLPEGTPVGHLKGRTINALVVMGAAHDDLIKGPGLWHARPGTPHTVVISGHRTTYGAPFRKINGLRLRDVLTLKTPYGTFRYKVRRKLIVKPSDVWVAQDVGHEQLVLTACHPVYSAAQRYVIFADRLTSRT